MINFIDWFGFVSFPGGGVIVLSLTLSALDNDEVVILFRITIVFEDSGLLWCYAVPMDE
jgi:hypothetical protein